MRIFSIISEFCVHVFKSERTIYEFFHKVSAEKSGALKFHFRNNVANEHKIHEQDQGRM